MKELLMGNEAIAVGAMMAGVQVISGYPGTPSTEVLETIAKRNQGQIYVEWSVNEKAGMEVAAGAAYAGARSLVTMKQVGLNVASDPLMSLNMIGVKGGMVVYVADDPGPISSQTEQDTRHYAKFAKIPIFDATSPEEAYQMIQDAFDYSEKYHTPVFFRATTRVCHACASIEVGEFPELSPVEGFVKDSKWVIFPGLSYRNKIKVEARELTLAEDFSQYAGNELIGSGKIGIACGGIAYAYVMDAIEDKKELFTIAKVTTPFPFPTTFADRFLSQVDRVIVFEELDPVIEDALIYHQGVTHTTHEILGKRTGTVLNAGELSAKYIAGILNNTYKLDLPFGIRTYEDAPTVPMRPPVLCAGCPHRASFYAVKQAMKGKKAVFCGDIGCYTLGNAAPLDMVDTCLCMGAGITIAQGLEHSKSAGTKFAFVGDSTFFASGMTGVVNAVYNKADMILVVLDNSTTAMTGHQPHPGLGKTMMGEVSSAVSIEKVLTAIGVDVKVVNPLELEEAIAIVSEMDAKSGVRAIIFRSPCVAIAKPDKARKIDTATCIGCMKCIRELGCPALSKQDGKAVIDPSLCTGCGLCSKICPSGCIQKD